MARFKTLDIGSSLVIGVTSVLFALSLLLKGFTHELLLESAVFLVSVKLIIMSHNSNVMKQSMESKLDDIQNVLRDECNNRERPIQNMTVVRRGAERTLRGERTQSKTRA